MANKKILKFPKDFLWGVSTSAYQIEGGINCDWSEWEKSEKRVKDLKKKGLNPQNFVCGRACDSYNKFDQDLKCIKELNLNSYRMGIEWARIEPIEGKFDLAEIEHYRKILTKLKKENIKVVLTLWHWTNPVWLTEKGGWSNKTVVDCFSCYVEKVVEELVELVDYWVVLNEPLIHVFNGYIINKFPPGKRCLIQANRVFNNLVKAHRQAYGIIHKHDPEAQVSITQIVNYFEPTNKWNPIEVGLSKAMHYFWNHRFLEKIKDSLDYIGVDYYFHDKIVWYPPFKKNLNKITNDMGWEIYPEGIYQVLKYLDKFKKPIIIMENGLADSEDKYRVKFIVNHLKYVHEAINEGIDVRGYFHWSLLDNFEWAAGFEPKFGLYKIDKNFNRITRKSAEIYADICKNNKIMLI